MYIKLNEAKDSIGQDINIGDKVAFSQYQTGNVMPGVVTNIINYKLYDNPQIKIEIKCTYDSIVSYIRYRTLILVLEKGN